MRILLYGQDCQILHFYFAINTVTSNATLYSRAKNREPDFSGQGDKIREWADKAERGTVTISKWFLHRTEGLDSLAIRSVRRSWDMLGYIVSDK